MMSSSSQAGCSYEAKVISCQELSKLPPSKVWDARGHFIPFACSLCPHFEHTAFDSCTAYCTTAPTPRSAS
jgi:hypothetical protein